MKISAIYKEQLLDDFEEDEILCYGRRLLNKGY
jgi:hypothetical protein